jgi:hypothetical protein
MQTMVSVMDIAELPEREMLSVLRQGSLLRLPHLEARLRHAEEQVARFEAAWQTTLGELLAQGLPDDANWQLHEDFIEWEYWHEVRHETAMIIENMKRILKKSGESSVLH